MGKQRRKKEGQRKKRRKQTNTQLRRGNLDKVSRPTTLDANAVVSGGGDACCTQRHHQRCRGSIHRGSREGDAWCPRARNESAGVRTKHTTMETIFARSHRPFPVQNTPNCTCTGSESARLLPAMVIEEVVDSSTTAEGENAVAVRVTTRRKKRRK